MYLVDANGNEVAAYDYDPYGKIISATGTMAEINPLRSPNKIGYSATAYIADTSWVFTIFKNINIRITGNIGVGAIAMGTWSGVEFGASFGIGFNISINWEAVGTDAKEFIS